MNAHSMPYRAASSLPRRHFGSEGRLVGGTARQSLALENANLDLGCVQPAGVHPSVVKFDPAPDARGGFPAKDLLEAAVQMGVEIVEHQMHFAHLGVRAALHPADEPDEIFRGAPLDLLHMAPLAERLDGDKDVARAGALAILPQRHAGRSRQGATRLAKQLLARLVHADHRLGGNVGPAVEREHLAHPSAALFGQLADVRHHPPSGLEGVFLRPAGSSPG